MVFKNNGGTLLTCPPTAGVLMSPDGFGFGEPGETVTHTMMVTNTGNIPDTFDVVASGETWTTTLSHSSVSLDPGESMMIMAWVEIPADAMDGESDMVTVTATSQTDPTESASAVLTTTAIVPETFTYLPLITKVFVP